MALKEFHIHLVSDATGGTLDSVAKAVLSQFGDVEAHQHPWAFVRTVQQIERVIGEIEKNPGFVIFTLVDGKLRQALVESCARLDLPCVALLEPLTEGLAGYLGMESQNQPGRQHVLDEEYFDRIEALHYAMAHDDGLAPENLDEAQIILIGVSRTTKTPTSIYLANRGFKTANVPIVPACPLPEQISEVGNGTLIVGLTISPDQLVPVRRHRLTSLKQDATEYVDPEIVKLELAAARKIFSANEWPVIDVTRRSVEETAAAIINLHARRQGD